MLIELSQLLPHNIHFSQIVRVLSDCIFCPIKPLFLNFPALSPSPYQRKLIHLTFRKNTTPFPAKNPAPPPGIKVSAREARRFQHAVGREFYTTWRKLLSLSLSRIPISNILPLCIGLYPF